jgi:anti-sigma factor RsiW
MIVLFRDSQRQHVDPDLLSAYLDNQVTSTERDRIERHLGACETCQRELDVLRQTVALLRAMPRAPVPRAFVLSEAQVGIRRPAARPAWYGGALRGMGAVAAIVMVALIATTLLQQPAWTPSPMVARAPKVAPEATAAPAAAPREATTEVMLEKVVVEAPTVAPAAAADTAAPVVTVESAEEALRSAAQPTEAPPTLAQPAEAPLPAPEAQESPALEAAAGAEVPTPETALMADSKAMAAVATPPGPPAPAAEAASAAAPGLGGGGGGMGAAGPAAAEAEGLTAEPPPLAAPAASVLPPAAGVVYIDQGSLWMLDRQSGQRQVLQASDISSPVISDDRAWIAYRSQQPDHVEFWAVPWDGQQPRLVVDERSLPARSLPQGYRERRVQSMNWIPGQHRLAVVTIATPGEANLPPEYELWNVDVESGEMEYVTRMAQADRPFYAPGGKRFALLNTGEPGGGLSLFNADGSGARSAPGVPQSASGPVYNWQVSWLADGGGLWVAVPEPSAGMALYRVPASGQAEMVRHIDASDAYWSPDGSRLAYTKPVSDSLDTRELYLANADGSDPSLYATPRYWAFLGWSPDGRHFLYQDNQQVYLGSPSQPPQALGNFLSIFDPRWISAEQFLHFLDQNASWVLVSRRLDGRAASLATLPRDADYDVTPR